MSNLLSAIDALASVPNRSWSDTEIDDTIAEVHRAEAKLISLKARLVAEAERRAFYEVLGFGSAAAWLRVRLNVAHGVARGLVSLGRGLRDCIGAGLALSDGDIDVSRAHTLVEAQRSHPDAYRASEEVLVHAARDLSPGDFRTAIDYWSQAADPDRFSQTQEALRDRRQISVSSTWEGMTRVDGWLDPESGAIVRAAFDAYCDAAGRDRDDDRSRGQVRADALTDICRFTLEHDDLPDTGGFRPQITVVVDLETLEGRAGYRSDLDGATLTPDAARRIACDAGISRIITDGRSEPLDVGRTVRTATPAQRRALAVRDGGCVIDGCDMPAKYTDAHHVIHWADGGTTTIRLLVLLCRRHHHGVHIGTTQLPERFRGPGP